MKNNKDKLSLSNLRAFNLIKKSFPQNDELKELIKNCSDINAKDKDGVDLMEYAIKSKNNDIIKLILDRPDYDINAKDKDGVDAIMKALEQKNLKALELLLYKNKNIKDKNEYTDILSEYSRFLKSYNYH